MHEATLTGEDVVPGFACPVGQLFECVKGGGCRGSGPHNNTISKL